MSQARESSSASQCASGKVGSLADSCQRPRLKNRRCLRGDRRSSGPILVYGSHELTACKNDHAKRSPKRVLKVLTDDDWERQKECWRVTPLAVLKDRGKDNGLTGLS